MSTSATAPRRASSLARVFRFSVTDYHRIGETGILGPDLRTELIDGEIVEIPPIGHPESACDNHNEGSLRRGFFASGFAGLWTLRFRPSER